MNRAFTILFMICITALSGLAADFDISLDVQADDKQIEQTVKKYLVRELSSIRDVRIADKGIWKIRVMVVKHKTDEDGVFVYSLSAVISSRAKCSVAGDNVEAAASEECDRFEDFAVYMGRQKNLQTMSREFISDFDTKFLEFMREPQLSELADEPLD